jgi:hypothetical protein
VQWLPMTSSAFTAALPYSDGPVYVSGLVTCMLCAVYSYFSAGTSRKEYSYTQKNMPKTEELKKVKTLNCPCRMRSCVIGYSID